LALIVVIVDLVSSLFWLCPAHRIGFVPVGM
jgi:hypothetical protein